MGVVCLCTFVLWYVNVTSLQGIHYSYLITDPLNNVSGPNVFAYLDIGHAEDWRDYWLILNKSLIISPVKGWEGEYYVKFWAPQWKEIMFNEVEKIAKMGFGGLMLDNLDACINLTSVNPNACRDMIYLVNNITEYAGKYGLKVIVNLGSVPWMALNVSSWGVLREETLCPLDPDAYKYLLKAKEMGKVVIDVEYNQSEECYLRALEACSNGIYVYLAPDYALDKPSRYCLALPSITPLLALALRGSFSLFSRVRHSQYSQRDQRGSSP